MADSKLALPTTPPHSGSTSPPPNCAICLGTCTNKCFSDSCMHEFCFKCLLEWSKIKAECPLCKQAFKSIIHNIKSLDEYDEHIVENIAVEENRFPDPFHQYHFRTTFTVDTHGEHALQQMLLRHPLLHIGTFTPERFTHRRRRGDTSATTFRRSIYNRNLWVYAPPDITGRYRDCSPSFFRNNPAARTRLAPWLNRELNALLFENTQQVMHLVDVIMDHLLRHHIYSYMFRSLLTNFLGSKTDHFIHEFYNFMRSPFDMIGYDRYVIYSERRPSPIPYIDISDYDRDVILVSDTDDNNPEQQVVTDSVIINLDTDSDEPIIVSEERNDTVTHCLNNSSEEEQRETVLPIKIRLKTNRHKPKEKKKRGRKRSRYVDSRNSSSSSSSSSRSRSSSFSSSSDSTIDYNVDEAVAAAAAAVSSPDSDYEHRKHQQKKLLKRLTKNKKRKDSKIKKEKHEDFVNNEPSIPVLNLVRNRKKSKHWERKYKTHTITKPCNKKVKLSNDDESVRLGEFSPSNGWALNCDMAIKNETKIEPSSSFSENSVDSSEVNAGHRVKEEVEEGVEIKENADCDSTTGFQEGSCPVPSVKSKIKDLRNDKAGPSSGRCRNVSKMEDPYSFWYSRPPYTYDSEDSSET